jgi:hypothetical protein
MELVPACPNLLSWNGFSKIALLNRPHSRAVASNILALRDLVLVAKSDRLRSPPEPGDGVTIVSRVEAFGSAVQDLAQSVPGAIPIVHPHES